MKAGQNLDFHTFAIRRLGARRAVAEADSTLIAGSSGIAREPVHATVQLFESSSVVAARRTVPNVLR